MINNVSVLVICDKCLKTIFVELEPIYTDPIENRGRYDDSKESIENTLVWEHGWFVFEGKHFCSQMCKENTIVKDLGFES